MLSRVKIDVAAGMYWEFFNFLIDNEFYITDICSTDIGFTAICLARDYRRIARIAKKFQCRTRVLKRKGVYFHCKNILKRKGILLGIVLFFVATALYNNIIWAIDISAPTPNIKEDIYSLLYINNIYAGSVFSQEKHSAAVQDIFMKVDNIGYVTLNFSKGLISCKVEEKIEKLPYLAGQFNGDIVATVDGVITDLRVYKGFSKVTLGQTVAKGDLLVSAAEVNKRGEECKVLPRAYIKAYGNKKYTGEVALQKQVILRNGNTQKQVKIKLPWKNIIVKKAHIDGWESYDTVAKFKFLSIMGFKLPATVETIKYYEKVPTLISTDKEVTKQKAYNIVNVMVESDPCVIETESYEYYIEQTDNTVKISCTVFGYFDITK